jgi:hypothetical protein
VVSLYLNITGVAEDAAEQVRLRWKGLRSRLSDDGAPDAALVALDTCVESAHPGAMLAVFATDAGLRWVQHLPWHHGDSVAVVGKLPSLVPLLTARQREIPFVVVATDRLGADLLAVVPDEGDTQRTVEGEELHVTRSAPGGWSQRRFQQRAENRWEANAGEVADAVTRLADDTGAQLVVATGDVRAVQFLRAALPPRVSSLLVEVQGDYRTVDNATERAHVLAAEIAVRQTELVLTDYARELGQIGNACAGVGPVLTALSAGQAATVLLAGHTEQAPLDDVLIQAAAATDADVWIVSPGAPQLDDSGVGALLRYASEALPTGPEAQRNRSD